VVNVKMENGTVEINSEAEVAADWKNLRMRVVNVHRTTE
jgi:hypothetical protein